VPLAIADPRKILLCVIVADKIIFAQRRSLANVAAATGPMNVMCLSF